MQSTFRTFFEKYNYFLAGAFGLLLLWSALNPISRADWFTENVLVLIVILVIFATGYFFTLSKLSATLFIIYLSLHSVGAHFTYSQVPLGEFIGHLFGSTRNMFDRLEHFCFGFLVFYPLKETLIRFAKVTGFWAYAFPFAVIGAFSAIYEILEWIAGTIISPSTAIAFVGAQGDMWDSQKDMAVAFVGTLLAIGLTLLSVYLKKRKLGTSVN